MENEKNDFVTRVTFDDVFDFALKWIYFKYRMNPDLQKVILVNTKRLWKIYKDNQSDEMKALHLLNKIRPTGKFRTPNLKECPDCKTNINVIKNGFDKRKRQRYKCNTCKKAFF